MTIPSDSKALVEAINVLLPFAEDRGLAALDNMHRETACTLARQALASISSREEVPAEAADLTAPYIPVAVHYPEADTLEFVLRDVPTISAYALPSLDSLHDLETREPVGWRVRGWSKIAPRAPATQAEREAVEHLIARHLQYIANPSAVAKPLADAILSLLESRRTPPDPHPLTALLTRWDNGESVGDLITQYLRGEGDWGPVRVLVENRS